MVLLKQVFLRRKTHKGKAIKLYPIFNFSPDYNGTLHVIHAVSPARTFIAHFIVWKWRKTAGPN